MSDPIALAYLDRLALEDLEHPVIRRRGELMAALPITVDDVMSTRPCRTWGSAMIDRDLEREPRRPSRHGGSLYDPVPAPVQPREIRAGQFSALVREQLRPSLHGRQRVCGYLVYNDKKRAVADEHSGLVTVVWLPDGSSYSAAASAATSEVARLHYEQQLAKLAAARSAS